MSLASGVKSPLATLVVSSPPLKSHPFLTEAQADALLSLFDDAARPIALVEALLDRVSSQRREQLLKDALRRAIFTADEKSIVRIAPQIDPTMVWAIWHETPKPPDDWDERLSLIAVSLSLTPAQRQAALDPMCTELRDVSGTSPRRLELMCRLLAVVDRYTAAFYIEDILANWRGPDVLRLASPSFDESAIRRLAESAIDHLEEEREVIR